MSKNIDDISYIFRVSSHSDTISANNSQLGECRKNWTISTIYRQYIDKNRRYIDNISVLIQRLLRIGGRLRFCSLL